MGLLLEQLVIGPIDIYNSGSGKPLLATAGPGTVAWANDTGRDVLVYIHIELYNLAVDATETLTFVVQWDKDASGSLVKSLHQETVNKRSVAGIWHSDRPYFIPSAGRVDVHVTSSDTDDTTVNNPLDGTFRIIDAQADVDVRAVGGATPISAADILAQATAALVAANLDHLMLTPVANNADMTVEVADGTALSNMLSKTSDTSTYVPGTDSLEANADNEIAASAIADAVLAEAIADHSGTAGSLAEYVKFIQDVLEGDVSIDTSDSTQYQLVVKIKSTSTELVRKDLKKLDGTAWTAATAIIGQHTEP